MREKPHDSRIATAATSGYVFERFPSTTPSGRIVTAGYPTNEQIRQADGVLLMDADRWHLTIPPAIPGSSLTDAYVRIVVDSMNAAEIRHLILRIERLRAQRSQAD